MRASIPRGFRLAALFSGTALLAACGGSGGSTTPAVYTVAGSVSGLDGSLTLKANTTTATLTSDGSFTIGDGFSAGTSVTLSITSAPADQDCEITSATSFTVNADVSNVSVVCTDLPGSVSGLVTNYYTGEAISGATVTVYRVQADGTSTEAGVTTTAADGSYSLAALGSAERYSIVATAVGYSSDAVAVTSSDPDPELSPDNLQLLPAQAEPTFTAQNGGTFAINDDTIVEVPANALVTADGAAATGDAEATLTVLDPSSDTEILPGALVARDAATSTTALIESFGAVEVRSSDSQGDALALGSASTATIHIPVATAALGNLGAGDIALYYYDSSTGYWIEDGSATLSSSGGSYFLVGSVSRLGTWSAAAPYDTVTIHGCVVDESGSAASGIRVRTQGRDYIGADTTLTDANGDFSVDAATDSQVLLSALANGATRTTSLSLGEDDLTLSSCLVLESAAATVTLTWGENPRDLDSHFFIPTDTGEAEVYFLNKTYTDGTNAYYLDVDDVTSFGPEVVTATAFVPGTYRYVVYLYAGTGTIASSPARVELVIGGTHYVYSPANASGDNTERYWHVFNLVVDSAGNVSVQTVQQFADSKTLDSSTSNVAARALKAPASLGDQLLEQKYYAN